MAIGDGPVEFHVYGCCKIFVFSSTVATTVSNPNGRAYLGYTSEAGVTVAFDPKYLPVYTDAFGDQVPEDLQDMGLLATLDFELLKWDNTVLEALQTYASGSDGQPEPDGTVAENLGKQQNADKDDSLVIGALLKQCGRTFAVALQRGTLGSETNVGCETNTVGPYVFGTCYVGPDSFNTGTKTTRHKLTINCMPNASGQLYQKGAAYF